MKNIFFIYLAIFSIGSLLFTSCDSDSNDPETTPPTISVSGDNTATVAASMKAPFNITAVKGSMDLKTVSVILNGQTADLSSFSINGITPSSNPVLLGSPDTKGFSYNIAFNAPSEAQARAKATIAKLAAFSINSILKKTIMALRRDKTPTVPILNIIALRAI